MEILSVVGTLERIAAMLGSPSNTVNASGRFVWDPMWLHRKLTAQQEGPPVLTGLSDQARRPD